MQDFGQPMEEKHLPPWKEIAMVVGAVLVVVLLIFLALAFVRSRQEQSVEDQKTDRTISQVEQSLETCNNAADPETCRANRIRDAAKATQEIAVCAMLEDEAYEECVWVTAQENENPAFCAHLLSEDRRVRCSDDLNIILALKFSDSRFCEKVVTDQRRHDCAETLLGPVNSETCLPRGYDQAYCQALLVIEQAVEEKDPSFCEELGVENAEYGACLDAIGFADPDTDGMSSSQEQDFGTDETNPDTDGDGLLDGEEVHVWGTDPLNPDTDGDTFLDGQEVNDGYSPTGSGTL